MADHNLGIGDFLLFQYDGDLNFVVLVFDQTSCEKEDTFHAFPCHEVKVQVENQGTKRAREASVNKLDTADPVRDVDCRIADLGQPFVPQTICLHLLCWAVISISCVSGACRHASTSNCTIATAKEY